MGLTSRHFRFQLLMSLEDSIQQEMKKLIILIVVLVLLWGPSIALRLGNRTLYQDEQVFVMINNRPTWLPIIDHAELIQHPYGNAQVETYYLGEQIDRHSLDDFACKIPGLRIEVKGDRINFFDADNPSRQPDYLVIIWDLRDSEGDSP